MNEVLKVDKMEGKTLVCMVGLPYSGKSHKAKQLSFGEGWPVVCPDSIRVALHGRKFIPEAEPYVWAIAKTMIRALFLSGHNAVILDATNTTKKRRDEWISKDWSTHFSYVGTPKDVCIKRATEMGDAHILPIIESMANTMDVEGIEKEVEHYDFMKRMTRKNKHP